MDDSLGDRMKGYENINRHQLMLRLPVVIRVDGRAFHTYTRKFTKPFDAILMGAMSFSACKLAEELENFQIGYVQSDEASFIMNNIADFSTQAWFNNNLQKIVSVSASTFTVYFNNYIKYNNTRPHHDLDAMFDARAFNIPSEEVANYLLWRSRDWSRNSLNMFARSIFSHKELESKTTTDVHDMLHKKDINWLTAANNKERNGTFLIRKANGVVTESPDHEIIQREIQYIYDDVIKLQQTKKET
jgi:tRNA(His) guanylyltransferase